jgi:Flp pilus assembly protein TadB
MAGNNDQNMGCGCLSLILLIAGAAAVFKFAGTALGVTGIFFLIALLIIAGIIYSAQEKKQKAADKVITDKFEDALEAMNASQTESGDITDRLEKVLDSLQTESEDITEEGHKRCILCNNEIGVDEKFCKHCGAKQVPSLNK